MLSALALLLQNQVEHRAYAVHTDELIPAAASIDGWYLQKDYILYWHENHSLVINVCDLDSGKKIVHNEPDIFYCGTGSDGTLIISEGLYRVNTLNPERKEWTGTVADRWSQGVRITPLTNSVILTDTKSKNDESEVAFTICLVLTQSKQLA